MYVKIYAIIKLTDASIGQFNAILLVILKKELWLNGLMIIHFDQGKGNCVELQYWILFKVGVTELFGVFLGETLIPHN